MAKRSFQQHLDPQHGPKRILAIDGGGLRGVVALAFLERIEAILAERSGAGSGFRLSDHYDLIAGTSTGAIIAACLALGMPVAAIREHYHSLGARVFRRRASSRVPVAGHLLNMLRSRYESQVASTALREIFGDRTVGSPDLRTALLVIAKRLDTGSLWPITNHPASRFYGGGETQTFDGVPNKDYPLWALVRASTAAPTFFAPESIRIAGDVHGEFVDGGVSVANNPALQAVLTATAKGYGFHWPQGAERLLVTSVGTGRAGAEPGITSGMQRAAAFHGMRALKSVLVDCSDFVETMMQWLSDSPTARAIDSEIGDLAGDYAGGVPVLGYVRYNLHFREPWVREMLGRRESQADLDLLAMMDRPENMQRLEEIGRAAAQKLVDASHF